MADGEQIEDGDRGIIEYFIGPHDPNITKVYIESEKLKNAEGSETNAIKLTVYEEMHGTKRIRKELLLYIESSGALKIVDDIDLERN